MSRSPHRGTVVPSGSSSPTGPVTYGGSHVSPVFHVDQTPDLEIRLEAFRLRDLPWAYLLRRHFQGDVRGYLEHIRARVPERRMRVALVEKDEES